MSEQNSSNADVLVLGAVVAAAVAALSVWAAGTLATLLAGRTLGVGAGSMLEVLVGVISHPEDLQAAFGTSRIAPWWLFWPVLAVLDGTVATVVLIVLRRMWRFRYGNEDRERLGVKPEAAMATKEDLVTLHVQHPIKHRYLLGHKDGQLLATENRKLTGHGSGKGREAHRLDRGAVGLIGPSRVGKSASMLNAVHRWDYGPIVMASVKDDLLAPTLAHRRSLGECGVFDPTGDLSASYGQRGDAPAGWTDDLIVGWSPIGDVYTTDDAQRAARSICDAAPKAGEGGDFWAAQVQVLLSGLMWIAAHSPGKSMKDVVTWVYNQDRDDPAKGKVSEAMRLAHRIRAAATDRDMVEDCDRATGFLKSIWSQDAKIQSSIYVTANTTVWPWTIKPIALSADMESVDLDWLVSGVNTLYLCAPPDEYKRLTSVYGGLVDTLLKAAYRHERKNGPIDPPLLFIVDEAGNMPLEGLPEYVSTVAGLGVQLVTVWQDLSQMKVAYKESYETVLNNHLSKVFFPAQSSKDGLEYVSLLGGQEEVHQISETRSAETTLQNRQLNHSTTMTQLLPANVSRMMKPGDALLIHGTLPPAHIETLPWFKDKELVKRQVWSEDNDDMQGVPVGIRKDLRENQQRRPFETNEPRREGGHDEDSEGLAAVSADTEGFSLVEALNNSTGAPE